MAVNKDTEDAFRSGVIRHLLQDDCCESQLQEVRGLFEGIAYNESSRAYWISKGLIELSSSVITDALDSLTRAQELYDFNYGGQDWYTLSLRAKCFIALGDRSAAKRYVKMLKLGGQNTKSLEQHIAKMQINVKSQIEAKTRRRCSNPYC